MKKTKELHGLHVNWLFHMAVFTAALVLSLTLFGGHFSIVSHAESAGRVISSDGAYVRKSASTKADAVTSYPQNTVISIRSQIQATDGYTWYEVWATADTLGYIRADLVEITDGTTPPSSNQLPPTNTQEPAGSNLAPADVSRVNPVSATVANSGSGGVRIRSNASAKSDILDTVQDGLALTVNGQAVSLDGDNKTWYQVNFISNNVEVSGFIRSDYVQLSENLTPYTEPVAPTEQSTEPEPSQPTDQQPAASKDYDTYQSDGVWYVTIPDGKAYDIEGLLQVNDYVTTLSDNEKSVKSQKIVIVILIFLLIAAAGAIGYLIFKIKDMADYAYFNEVETETLRRRSAQAGQGSRGMHNVGADKKGAPQGQRPAGAPQGQRPAGAPQGQRPAGAPQGQRPAGAPQGQRPAGTPQGQRPAGAPQGQRPAGAPQGQRPAGAPQGQRPSGAPQGQKHSGAPQGQGTNRPQPKNFMAGDDDEFEFEFLNYDGEEEK